MNKTWVLLLFAALACPLGLASSVFPEDDDDTRERLQSYRRFDGWTLVRPEGLYVSFNGVEILRGQLFYQGLEDDYLPSEGFLYFYKRTNNSFAGIRVAFEPSGQAGTLYELTGRIAKDLHRTILSRVFGKIENPSHEKGRPFVFARLQGVMVDLLHLDLSTTVGKGGMDYRHIPSGIPSVKSIYGDYELITPSRRDNDLLTISLTKVKPSRELLKPLARRFRTQCKKAIYWFLK